MIKKILFSSLQRFDLKDANELQQGVLDKLEYAVKMVSPTEDEANDRQSYPITKVNFTGNSNGELIPSGPFAVLTNQHDIIVITQEDIDAGLCRWDYTSAYADYQSDVNAGGSPTGLYFWAYPVYENTDVESREFYSIIDGVPYNQDVATRQRARLETFVNSSAAYNIPNAEGYYPIKVAYVLAADIDATVNVPASPWQVSNIKGISNWDTIVLPNTSFTSDSGHPNYGRADVTTQGVLNKDHSTYPSSRDKNLNEAFERIERELLRIKSYGSLDPTDTAISQLGVKNPYSLQGLKALIDDANQTIADTVSFTVAARYTKAGSGTDISGRLYYDVPTDPAPRSNQIAVVPRFNYLTVYAKSGTVATPYPATTPNSQAEEDFINDASNFPSTLDRHQILGNIHIKIPDHYLGYYIQDCTMNYVDKYSLNLSLGDTGMYSPNTSNLIIANGMGQLGFRRYANTDDASADTGFDNLATVQAAPAIYLSASGVSELHNDPGINLHLAPCHSMFSALDNGETIAFTFHITLRKRY